jgi:hypothetical protein
MYWDSFRFVARDLGVRYMMAPSRTRSELVSRRLLCEYLRQFRRGWVRGSFSLHVASSCDEGSNVRKISLARAAPAAIHPHLLVSVSGGR